MSAGLIYGLSALFGYFVGSIPFGLILTRLAGYGDIRKIGSGNIGATNVLRTGNKTLALLTVLCVRLKQVLRSNCRNCCRRRFSRGGYGFPDGRSIRRFGA